MGQQWVAITSFLSSKRNIRAKIGSAEIELHTVEKLQEKIAQIAEEADPEKRLEIAKEALAIDDAIRELTAKDMELLAVLDKDMSPAFLYWPYTREEEQESYNKLHRLKLVSSMPLSGGEDIGVVSTIGKEVLKKLTKEREDSETRTIRRNSE